MGDNESGTNFLKEWEESRRVIREYDGRLHDLRKYGFSFITALLSASTILFEKWLVAPSPAPGSSGEVFPEAIKAAVLIITLFLILGLNILDRSYRGIQKAAQTRLCVLENYLNFEISESIQLRFQMGWIQSFIASVYILFIVGIEILGYVVLSNTFWVLSAFAVAITGFIFVISVDIVLERFGYGYLDWILDKTEVEQGEYVHIIMTNLGKKDFPKDDIRIPDKEIWTLKKQPIVLGESDDKKKTYEKKDKLKIMKKGKLPKVKIEPNKNYTWTIDTSDLETGIYCLYRTTFKKNCKIKDRVVLGRKLIITEKPSASQPKPTVHHVILKPESED